MSLKYLALFAAVAMAGPALAQGAQLDLPQTTSANYRDWTLRCDHRIGTPPGKVCEVAQLLRSGDGQSIIAQVVLGRFAPDRPFELIVQLPTGVWLPANVWLEADAATAVTAIYTRCQQLCVANADVDDAFVQALRAGTEPARLVFQDIAGQDIVLPVSLNGLTAALNAAEQ